MISAFLDSFVFSCRADPSEDEVLALVRSLLQWRDIVKDEWIRLYVSDQAVDCISLAGCGFPPWAVLAESIRRNRLPVTAQDVMAVFNGFLSRLPKIEEDLGVTDVLLSSARCVPPVHQNRSQVFQADFERLLALICLYSEIHQLDPNDSCAVLSRELRPCPAEVDFSAQLEDADPAAGQAVPRRLSTTIDVFSCPSRYLASLDPVVIWTQATSVGEFSAAIKLNTERVARVSNAQNAFSWHFGREFVATVEGLNLRHKRVAQSIVGACSDTILAQNLQQTHWIRTSASPDSPQVRRGTAAAWRRDVDYDLHLHYWMSPRGVEFAAIRQHDDLSIP
jgi:hypothetical protein